MSSYPSGTVTFLFTDIEGSTKLAQAYPDAWEALRARHHAILHSAIDAYNGTVFQIIGDAFCAAFHTAPEALKAAIEAQRRLHQEAWTPAPIKIRIGINTGVAQLGNLDDHSGGYIGYTTLARVQRVMSIGHGGQILLSNTACELVRGELPTDVTLHDMGEHARSLVEPGSLPSAPSSRPRRSLLRHPDGGGTCGKSPYPNELSEFRHLSEILWPCATARCTLDRGGVSRLQPLSH